jgi:protein TonB
MTLLRAFPPLLIVSMYLASCSTHSNVKDNEVAPQSQRDAQQQDIFANFKAAYAKYDQGQYIEAISLFDAICKSDSNAADYEAYGFIADSYNRLGHVESGLDVYERAINKISKLRISHPISVSYAWKCDSLVAWRTRYPKFPEFLKKENGFVPYDEFGAPIYSPAPNYPMLARRSGIQGTVWLRAIIDESGSVTQTSILKSVEESLDNASIDALKKWKFKPFKIKGRVAKAEVSVPFKFQVKY